MPRMTGVVAFLFLLMLNGCAPTPAARISGRAISPEAVKRIVRANHELVHSMKGTGTISIETPDAAQSGSFELQLRKPDSVLVDVEGPFGINVGSVLLTRSRFIFYNSFQNQLVDGAVTPANLRRIFKMEITFDELLTLFTGGAFLKEDEGEPDSLREEENQIMMTYRSPQGQRRYFVDPMSMLITRVQFLDTSGKLFLEQRFERFRTMGDVSLPRYIRLTQHTARRAISVSFSSLEVNVGGAPLALDIPANAERIKWKE